MNGFVFKAASSSHSFSARIVSDACQSASPGRLAYFGDINREPIEDDQGTETVTEPGVLGNPWGETSFYIYPNPTHRYLNIACNENGFFKVVVISQAGVIAKEFDAFGRLFTLDVSALKNGVYWIKVIKPGHNSAEVFKLAVNH